MKHLQHQHKMIYKEVLELNFSRQESASTTARQKTIPDMVLEECTNLVAVHGRPFSIINDKAFKNLLALIPENKSTINALKVRENVKAMATNMRDQLANILHGKKISIKIDIASIGTRSFMGINCQYLENGKVLLKNLGVIEIFQRHTSEHLKEILIFNLHRFRINTEFNNQIYCITTDNGANMIKLSKLMNESCLGTNTSESDDVQAGPSSVEANESNNLCEDFNSEYNYDDETSELEHTFTNQVTTVLREQFMNAGESSGHEIGIVRCAAHTLQLALLDACKDETTCSLITSGREVVRRLRTPQFVRLLRQNYKNVPKLDCTTRWHSTIDMVESLLSLREICSTDERLQLPDSTWEALSEFVRCLMPARELTKKLQEEQLTVGDFYIAWMLCEFKITKMTAKIATDLLASMKNREKSLFQTDIFINGIFLDPRVNTILTPEQQNKAKANCIKLYIDNFELEQSDKENENINSENLLTTTTNERITEAQRDLDDFLNSRYIDNLDNLNLLLRRQSRPDIVDEIKQSMNMYLEEPLLKSTESVLAYWEKSREKFPYLYKLTTVVLAAPMTQVSVERLFSSLKFVVSQYRLSMKDDIIEDLLFIRCNKLFEKQ